MIEQSVDTTDQLGDHDGDDGEEGYELALLKLVSGELIICQVDSPVEMIMQLRFIEVFAPARVIFAPDGSGYSLMEWIPYTVPYQNLDVSHVMCANHVDELFLEGYEKFVVEIEERINNIESSTLDEILEEVETTKDAKKQLLH